MSTIANFTLVSAAFAAAESFAQRVDALRAAAKKDGVSFEPKAIKAWLAPATAQYYKVKLVAKERGEGVTWDKDTKSQTAKKQCDRLAASILGPRENHTEKEEVEIPAELLQAALKLAAIANKYEGSRGLAAKAIAKAFAQG